MIDLNQIAERIINPDLSGKEDFNELKDLTEKFPYSQVFPILYLKALSRNNYVHFDEELNRFAYRITDRAQLFDLIHGSDHKEVSHESDSDFEAPIIELKVVHAESSNDIIKEESIEENILTEIIEEDHNLEQLIDEQFTTDPVEIDQVNFDLVIEEQIHITDRPTILSNEDDIEEISDIEVEKFQSEMISQTIASAYQLEEQINKIEEEEIEEEISGDTSPKSFTAWLRSNVNDIPQIDVEKARIESIVDQFLVEQPSISRPSKGSEEIEKPKKEFYSAAKKAKESLDTNNIPVSETLAKIFVLQGNYPKAIFAYEQLMLANPEKKIFFASQIEELKKKLNP